MNKILIYLTYLNHKVYLLYIFNIIIWCSIALNIIYDFNQYIQIIRLIIILIYLLIIIKTYSIRFKKVKKYELYNYNKTSNCVYVDTLFIKSNITKHNIEYNILLKSIAYLYDIKIDYIKFKNIYKGVYKIDNLIEYIILNYNPIQSDDKVIVTMKKDYLKKSRIKKIKNIC